MLMVKYTTNVFGFKMYCCNNYNSNMQKENPHVIMIRPDHLRNPLQLNPIEVLPLSQNKWLLCFIALIQVVFLDQQGWNHNVIWEEVALLTSICVSLNVVLYSCFLHILSSSQSCNIVGSKRHCSTTDLKMMLIKLFIVQKELSNWCCVNSFVL